MSRLTMSGYSRGTKRQKEAEPDVTDFYLLGKEIENRSGSSIGAPGIEDRRFREYFGCAATVALIAWNLLSEHGLLSGGAVIIHLLWALHFMKVYPKQDAGSAAAGGSSRAIDVKTWKKYLWPFINALADLKDIVIDFAARKLNLLYNNDCLLSVDGTDFRVPQAGYKFASTRESLPCDMKLPSTSSKE